MKLEKNVLDFIEWGAKEIGKVEEDLRSRDMVNRCDVKEIKSPIEQLLYSALEIVRRLNGIDDEDYILEITRNMLLG